MKNIFIFVLVFVLTSCGIPLVSDLSQPGSILFQDDFSTATGGWARASAEQGSLAITDGAYKITVSISNYELPALSGHTYRDVRLQVGAVPLAGPVENLFGLICRARDVGNFYFFAISSDGYYAIGKVMDGQISLLGQEMMAYNDAIRQGEISNTLQFECQGQVLSGSVNGRLIASTQDADFTTGDAGLIAGAFEESGVEISFDNFIVIKP